MNQHAVACHPESEQGARPAEVGKVERVAPDDAAEIRHELQDVDALTEEREVPVRRFVGITPGPGPVKGQEAEPRVPGRDRREARLE